MPTSGRPRWLSVSDNVTTRTRNIRMPLLAFDSFVKKFPDAELCSEAVWGGARATGWAKNIPLAFQRYNRCRWDFPESDAAKYSWGRLALPEMMLNQFEKEAALDDE